MSCKVAQQLDLAQGTLGEDGLLKDLGDLLDSNILSSLSVLGSTIKIISHSADPIDKKKRKKKEGKCELRALHCTKIHQTRRVWKHGSMEAWKHSIEEYIWTRMREWTWTGFKTKYVLCALRREINVPDNTVGTLTDLANELVLCVDDELLVQDWE